MDVIDRMDESVQYKKHTDCAICRSSFLSWPFSLLRTFIVLANTALSIMERNFLFFFLWRQVSLMFYFVQLTSVIFWNYHRRSIIGRLINCHFRFLYINKNIDKKRC